MRLDHHLLAVALVAFGFCAAACGTDDDRSTGEGTVAQVTAPSSSVPSATGGPTDSIPAASRTSTTTWPAEPAGSTPMPGDSPAIQRAIADLASRLGVATDAVDIRSSEEVTWSDGSIGCPQPGMIYTQQLVSGQRVVLSVGERDFEYHGGGGGDLFFCADPTPPSAGGSGVGGG